MKVCLAGEGAQGTSHYAALSEIDGVEVVTLAGGVAADAEQFARERGIPHWSLSLEECLAREGVECCVLTTPNALHASQAQMSVNTTAGRTACPSSLADCLAVCTRGRAAPRDAGRPDTATSTRPS